MSRLFAAFAILLGAGVRLLHADQAADADMANRYLQAAKNGDAKAQYYLGSLYAAGVGVPLSDPEAFHWFSAAADRGNAEARLIVGGFYAVGRGVPQSYVNAYSSAVIAANTAELRETRTGAQQLMDILGERMSSTDVAEAKRLAQPHLPGAKQGVAAAAPAAGLPRPPAAPAPVSKDDKVAAKESGSDVNYDSLTADIGRNPQDAQNYVKRGSILAQRGDYAHAADDFGEALRLNPDDVHALNNRCWTRVMLNQAEAAITDCDRALQIQPDYVDALDSRGLANLKLGHYDRAISDFNAALRLKPKLASSLYGRGVAQIRRGNKFAGGADIFDARGIDPNIENEFHKYGIDYEH